jgi:hypothetical protein
LFCPRGLRATYFATFLRVGDQRSMIDEPESRGPQIVVDDSAAAGEEVELDLLQPPRLALAARWLVESMPPRRRRHACRARADASVTFGSVSACLEVLP